MTQSSCELYQCADRAKGVYHMMSIGEASPNVQKDENGKLGLLVPISTACSRVSSKTSDADSDIAWNGEASPKVQKDGNGEFRLLMLISMALSGVGSETICVKASESASDITEFRGC